DLALKSVPLERRQLFQNLQEQGRHEALILELEKSFTNAPFWLDCHYQVCEALAVLEAEEAQRAVENLVANFIARFPQLVQFAFADGVPFASDETRQWIESLRTGNGLAQERSEEHTSELQSRENLVCRLLLEKKKQRSANRR